MPKLKDLNIRTGGLMRCCTETINEMESEYPFHDGDFIECKYENKVTMVVDNMLIRWVGYKKAMEIDAALPKKVSTGMTING